MADRFEGKAVVIRGRRAFAVGALVVYVLGFLAEVVLGRHGGSIMGPLGSILSPVALILFLAASGRLWARRSTGVVRVDASNVTLDGSPLVRLAHIVEAYALAVSEPTIRIQARRAPFVDVQLTSEASARALLAALGRDVGHAVASFWGAHGTRGGIAATRTLVVLGIMALGVVAGVSAGYPHGGHRMVLGCAAFTGLGILFSVATTLCRVVIASDGILVRRIVGRRFISFGEVTGVAAHGERGITLTLRNGQNAVFYVSARGSNEKGAREEMRDAMLRRIEEAREAYERDRGTRDVQGLVAPGGRPLDRWLQEVRALGRSADYRAPAVRADRLWELVEDAGASPGARAGAAMALGALDAEARTRLRVAVETVADPRLRVALERVAEGAEEADIETAMEAFARE